jgi:SulP family sulfate permease
LSVAVSSTAINHQHCSIGDDVINRSFSSVRASFSRDTIKSDAVAGVVLGVESVPDGLAGGLLAGVNPVYGLYAYMVGTFSGALTTSSAFMAIQATGAMAIIVADIPAVHSGDQPERVLFTLSIVTGVVMLAAGLFKLGSLLRWVSNAVMVGFINAVGVNIILGQLNNFSGYEAEGANRVARAADLLFNLGKASFPTIVVGTLTIVLILVLERTKLGPLGLVVAVVITSFIGIAFGWEVLKLDDIANIPSRLPLPTVPLFGQVPSLIVPALSLAFVGLVQGAGISANFPNPDGNYPDASRDFAGQGIANIAVGVWQGMPVGGSMSATSLSVTAGAKTRLANLIAAVVMGISILLFSPIVSQIAMPALAGLLMVIGFRTIKPADIQAMIRTGPTQAVVMLVTFVLTMLIPLQNAVLAGIGISIILYIFQQSNRVKLKQWVFDDDGHTREIAPPQEVGSDEVIVLQPYGSLFFAAAQTFDHQLPEVTPFTRNSVVVLRLRGKSDIGSTFMDVLSRYAIKLRGADSKLMLIVSDPKMERQFEVTGVVVAVGDENIYTSDEWLGRTVRRAWMEGNEWVVANSSNEG